ncbi:WD40-repeat-containing domain protein [Leptodontidium sp. 2 PMI_412]|nr:WD40-repeat-containing domain protein [Leptodontidium sp. 2 PMI_412]
MNPTVDAIAFSPDCQMLALALDNGSIKIINRTTGQQPQKLEGHTNTESGMKVMLFSSNGQQLASAEADESEIKLWDLTTGELLKRKGLKNNVFAVAFSPDGWSLRIVSASRDGTIELYC